MATATRFKTKIMAALGISLLLMLTLRLFCGVYVHDEFGGKTWFVKHRPTWKWKFYSPIGMSDLRVQDLSEEQRQEQHYFDEFVSDQGLSR